MPLIEAARFSNLLVTDCESIRGPQNELNHGNFKQHHVHHWIYVYLDPHVVMTLVR